jgi:hypothetical protein
MKTTLACLIFLAALAGCEQQKTVYVDRATGAEYTHPAGAINPGDTLYVPYAAETEMYIVTRNLKSESVICGYIKYHFLGRWNVRYRNFTYREIEKEASRYEAPQ